MKRHGGGGLGCMRCHGIPASITGIRVAARHGFVLLLCMCSLGRRNKPPWRWVGPERGHGAQKAYSRVSAPLRSSIRGTSPSCPPEWMARCFAFLHNETGGTRGRGGGESQRHDSLDGRAANGHKPMYSGKSLGLFFFFFFSTE